ncbi:MAG TPA: PQ-loop domain-containing transporter [Candidatus Acidoferrales bacterium]|nr:PQ-loop domain-containing transporter [Candidatus Acidoferrales bacterium]
MKIVGLIGLIAIVACWIPQTLEVVRSKRSGMKLSFLLLYFPGSIALTVYAIGDPIFVILNLLTAIGSAVNLYFKVFPKNAEDKTS